MEKPTRHRKAFYQKENDHQNGNRKPQPFRSFPNKYPSSLPDQFHTLTHQKTTQSISKKTPKTDTELYCQLYQGQVIKKIDNYQVPGRFLDHHKIDWYMRARMLDWMVEVTAFYNFSDKTYFAAASIMDRYFQKQVECLSPQKLHIIGVVSIMIASKMQEVFPLKLKTVFEKITHKKISEKELTLFEARIFNTLNYKVNSWTFYDLAIAKLHILIQNLGKRKIGVLKTISNSYFTATQSENNLVDRIQKQMPRLQKVIGYVSKFLLYDYDMYSFGSLNLLSDVVLKLSLEILKIPCQLECVSTSQPIDMELWKQELRGKMARFEHKFKAVDNLRKFSDPEIVKLVKDQILSHSSF